MVAAAACQDPSAPSPSARADTAIPGEWIVTFRDDVEDVPGLAQHLAKSHGGTLRHAYTHALRGFAARLPARPPRP